MNQVLNAFDSNFKPWEMVVSVAFALAVFGGGVVAIQSANLASTADAPEIEKGSVPVRVIPVIDLDAPLLKLGGEKVRYKLPDQWVKQAPKARVEERATVSPKAEKTAEAAPDKSVKMEEADAAPPPPDAEVTKEVDNPNIVSDAGPSNVDEKGSQDGVKEGTETDPLKARAVDLYRARIAGWFRSRFRVSGSGLPPEEITKYKVGASIQIGSDRTVLGYSIQPSGNPVFDAAAKTALESAKGNPLPPPPENYPDIVQSQIHVTFMCSKETCD